MSKVLVHDSLQLVEQLEVGLHLPGNSLSLLQGGNCAAGCKVTERSGLLTPQATRSLHQNQNKILAVEPKTLTYVIRKIEIGVVFGPNDGKVRKPGADCELNS